METKAVSAEALKERLMAWLKAHNLEPETVAWYSPEAWRARDEGVGDDAVLSAVIERSPLFRILNHCTSEDVPIFDELNTFLEGLGYFYDLGFTWSIHFYEA